MLGGQYELARRAWYEAAAVHARDLPWSRSSALVVAHARARKQHVPAGGHAKPKRQALDAAGREKQGRAENQGVILLVDFRGWTSHKGI